MELLIQNVNVAFRYPVYFTTAVLEPDNPVLARVVARDPAAQAKRFVAVFDEGVLRHHPGQIEKLHGYAERHARLMSLAAPPLVLPGGEAAKNDPSMITRVHRLIEEAGIGRQTYVLAFGGGAVLDAVGYAAATARGTRLVRLPTTMLAQCECGVSVRNNINAQGRKDFLGAYAPPYAVVNDDVYLTRLSLRDWHSGIAAAIKVALIKDAGFFQDIRRRTLALIAREPAAGQALISRCARLNMDHTAHAADPFGQSASRPLDFGKWAAHALEELSHYRLRHGEAIAMGLALDVTYAWRVGLLPETTWIQVLTLLERLGCGLYVPEMSEPRLLEALAEAVDAGLTLLRDVGRPLDVREVDLGVYERAVASLASRHGRVAHETRSSIAAG